MDVRDWMEAFYGTIQDDPRVGTLHISLYMALFSAQTRQDQNPFEIDRDTLMQAAKIRARSTYHLAMHQLVEYGYIRYEPSLGTGSRSRIHLCKLL